MPLQSEGHFRSGLGDERRRRMLCDTTAFASVAPADPRPTELDDNPPAQQKSEHYGDATFMDQQARVTDLIPKRLSSFALLFLLGLSLIAGLVYLYSLMPRLAGYTHDGRVAAFDLDGEGSLAVWLSSTLLSLSGLVAILVYTVRRYRTDDYHGRYRVWLWAAMCWFVMSVDETGSVHEGFKEMMSVVTGTRIFGDGSIWWVIPYFFLLGAVGLRLLLDMRECWLSSSALVGAGAAYALSVIAQLGWLLGRGGAKEVMVEEGAELIGDLLILMAMGLHARFVILDAKGLSHSSPGEEKSDEPPVINSRQRTSRPDFTEVRWAEPEPAHPTPQPALKKPGPTPLVSKPAATPPLAGGLGTPPQSAHEKLSKADRKALRKRLLEMRQARQQQGG